MNPLQFLNGAGGSPKDRVALNVIQVVSPEDYPCITLFKTLTHSFRRKKKVFSTLTLETPFTKAPWDLREFHSLRWPEPGVT